MTSNFYAWILPVTFSLALAACDGRSADGTASGSSAGGTSSSSDGSTIATPTIFGTPAGSVTVGTAYTFHPGTTAPEGSSLAFGIKNQPAWTTFDAATGALSGTPTSSDVGTFANVEISVSDGGSSVALAPFSITVVNAAAAAVTLSWVPPRENTNGTSATNLAGYRIYYGATAKNLSQVITVEGGTTTFVFNQLPAGTWYFAVAAFNSEQVESDLSVVVPLNLGG
jgi:hypothetical protein